MGKQNVVIEVLRVANEDKLNKLVRYAGNIARMATGGSVDLLVHSNTRRMLQMICDSMPPGYGVFCIEDLVHTLSHHTVSSAEAVPSRINNLIQKGLGIKNGYGASIKDLRSGNIIVAIDTNDEVRNEVYDLFKEAHCLGVMPMWESV